QKSARMRAVHLRVMKLKRKRQVIPKPFLSISAPDDKRIVENAAVHSDSSVDFRIDNSRSADDHTVFGQVSVLTACRSPGRIFQILPVEFMQIRFIRKVTGTDFAFFVFYNSVHCYRVVLYELIPHRKDVKFLYLYGNSANTISKQHIEFQLSSPADPDQIRHIKCLEKSYHRIGRFHPKLIRRSPPGVFWINFFWHTLLLFLAQNIH